ncbi:MAG: hypothetical protein ACYDAC_09815 [Candidatus Dormibacteria bacterium]
MIDTTEASPLSAGEETKTRAAAPGERRPHAGAPARRAASGPSPANLPRIVRPAGLPRATHPAEPPAPEHRHLPGWVRRVHGQASPILADLLGGLSGTDHDRFQEDVDTLVAGMSAGRFSLAWNYPRLIEEGWQLLEAQRREGAAAFAAQRALDQRRRRAADALREAGTRLAPDVIARLSRSLRNAAGTEEIDAISAEIEQSVMVARSNAEKRRDREIDRTRSRIHRAMPRAAAASPPAQTWQEVLRSFAESQALE